jgi:glycerol kinase
MKHYILALDQGTTSSRSILFDFHGNIVAVSQEETTQYFPKEGYVEHDANEIWEKQLRTAQNAIREAHISASEIAAIGITNQRETVVVWDKQTGMPISNAIVWQCRRTAAECDKLRENPDNVKMIREKTGLLIDPYFSATKLRYILDNIPGARKKAEAGDLLFGTIDSWLIYRLTGGRVHATDYSNAARTLLFNINTCRWDEELLRFFDIPASMLPTACPSSGLFGESLPELFGEPIPIAGVAGDQQAALFGQCCFSKGDVKNTYGTGGFLLMNTGETPVLSDNGLLTTIAWGINGKVDYVLEGSVFVSGAGVQWLRDGLGLFANSAETEAIARSVPDNGGVYLVPALTGLGAPYWDPYARGSIMGITRGTTRAHIVRAMLEAMAYQTVDVLRLMERDAHVTLSELKVDGGASANNFLLQFQADILNARVIRPTCIETTALGAANLAALAVGVYASTDEISEKWQKDRVFRADLSEEKRDELLYYWHKAADRSLDWVKHSES